MSKHTSEACIFYESFFFFSPSSLQSKLCSETDWKIDFTQQLMPPFFPPLLFKKKVLFDQEVGASLSDTFGRVSTLALSCTL